MSEQKIALPPLEECPNCKGSGKKESLSFADSSKTVRVRCNPCRGTGKLPRNVEDLERQLLAALSELQRLKQYVKGVELTSENRELALNKWEKIANDIQAALNEARAYLRQIDDVLLVSWIVVENGDYKQALNDLVTWNIQVHDDPAVSEVAKERQDKLEALNLSHARLLAYLEYYEEIIQASFTSETNKKNVRRTIKESSGLM